MKYHLRGWILFFMIWTWWSSVAIAASASSDKSVAAKSAAEKTTPDKTDADKPATEKADADKVDNAAADKSASDKSTTDKSAVDKTAKEESTPAASTYTVKREPFKIQLELEGVFESSEMTEIVLHPEEWTAFTVMEAVEHGARVKKGDVLIRFDAEKIDKAIADLRTEQQIAEVALRQAEDQVSVLEKTTPLDLEASQRAQRIAEEDQKRYFETDRPMTLKTVENFVKFSRQYLEYSREELEQLEKMYKADDLTEETEKIVLKRARDKVERTEFELELNEFNRDMVVKFEVPRMDEQIKETAQRKNLAWAKDRVELPLALEKQRREAQRQKLQLARAKERLKTLLADQKLMIISAPSDGYVYYGHCQRGKFAEIAPLGEILLRGGNTAPHHVLMTIVKPRPIFIHATVAEEHLQYMHKDLEGVATPTGYPDIKLAVTVDETSRVL